MANPGSPLNEYYLAILCATSIVGRVSPGLIAFRVGRYVFEAVVLVQSSSLTEFSKVQSPVDFDLSFCHTHICPLVHFVLRSESRDIRGAVRYRCRPFLHLDTCMSL